jgi:serine/threonine protein phosphatase PrpC
MIPVHSFSEPGGHRVNEDAFEVHRHSAQPAGFLCVLADGQGGQAGAARAAQLACRTAAEAALRLSPQQLADALVWTAVLQQADQAVAADPEAGFTTLLGFWLADGLVAGASTGDSAVFARMQTGRIQDLTARQHKNPPLGSGEALLVPFAAALAAPYLVLAMSDGVWKYAGTERIVALPAGATGQEVIDALQSRARLPDSGGFPDDFTLVVFSSAG